MRATQERGWKMRTVKVKRDELLEKVRANLAKHREEYVAACTGYRAKALDKIDEVFDGLRKRVADLQEGQTIALMSVQFGLEVPQDHSKDYEQVIAMLEMSVDTELSIQSDEFACYVMDDWEWRQKWETTKLSYSGR